MGFLKLLNVIFRFLFKLFQYLKLKFYSRNFKLYNNHRSRLTRVLIILVSLILFLLILVDISSTKYNLKTIRYFLRGSIELKSQCECRKEKIKLNTRVFSDLLEDVDTTTCDLYSVMRRGYNQKIVSYSVSGLKEQDVSKIKYLAKLAAKHYSDWIVRVHYDYAINQSYICELECLKDELSGQYFDNVDFCNMNEIPSGNPINRWSAASFMHSTTWRYLPFGDPFVDIFVSRDIDAWIIDREIDAVSEWLQEETLFHIMRDHTTQNGFIIGGLWGFANRLNQSVATTIFNNYIKNAEIAKKTMKEQSDQSLLAEYIWPYAKLNAIIHDSFHCNKYKTKTRAFPSQRPSVYCHVGCSNCCEQKYTNETWYDICPKSCRPKNHESWIYC